MEKFTILAAERRRMLVSCSIVSRLALPNVSSARESARISRVRSDASVSDALCGTVSPMTSIARTSTAGASPPRAFDAMVAPTASGSAAPRARPANRATLPRKRGVHVEREPPDPASNEAPLIPGVPRSGVGLMGRSRLRDQGPSFTPDEAPGVAAFVMMIADGEDDLRGIADPLTGPVVA